MPCRPIESVDWDVVSDQWDRLADVRFRQITSGMDITYNHILMPVISTALEGKRYRNGLDVGCGVGVMTQRISNYCDNVVGIDISGKSVEIAREAFSQNNISFRKNSIENYATSSEAVHDFALASMFLMDTPDLVSSINAIGRSLIKSGDLLITIPHPAFWPDHYGYRDKEWFSYRSEMAIEMEFHISLEDSPMMSIHFHRPLEIYIESLLKAGFNITLFREIFPNPEAMRLYPKPWTAPRYLLIGCTKSAR